MTSVTAQTAAPNPHRFSVAPMMAWTDRHARYFMRLLSRRARLYTEMVPLNGLLHAGPERFLGHDPTEHPLALQVGGADPQGLAEAAKIAQAWGFDEINLNVGCPSDRVSSGHFGACLMAEPMLVAECVAAMTGATELPVTVKCRIGIDDMDTGAPLDRFISGVARAGCQTVIVHARKAWLKGLSPKENREVPPLDYDRVYELKHTFPDLTIVINGGIPTIEDCQPHLDHVDGVMLGRAAYEHPYILANVDRVLFGDHQSVPPTRYEAVMTFAEYCANEQDRGTPLHHMTRHILGLFHGCPGARSWRRFLSTEAVRDHATAEILVQSLQLVPAARDAA